MTRLVIYAVGWLIICFSNNAHSSISAIESDAGLADRYITNICRDNRGLMWIGTRQGLCMYDGYRFIPLNDSSLNGTLISKLLYDTSKDILWVAIDKGLFSVRCGRLQTTCLWRGSGDAITDIALSPNGILYVAYRSGAIAAARADASITLIARLPKIAGAAEYASRIEVFSRDTLCIRMGHTFYRLSIRSASLQRHPADSVLEGAYFTKSAGNLQFAFYYSELKMRSSDGGISPYTFGESVLNIQNPFDIQLTSGNILYVLGKPSMLYRIDLSGGHRDTVLSDVFTGRMFTCSFMAPEHILWIGTNKGLIKVTFDNTFFEHFLVQKPSVSIRSLVEDEAGNLYTGTYSGLYVSRNRGADWSILSPMIPYAIQNMTGKYLYFVGEQKRLYRINKRSGQVETDFYRKQGLPADELNEAYTLVNASGQLLIGTINGLFVYDPVANVMSLPQAGREQLANIRISCITKIRNGSFLLSCNTGLKEFDLQKGITWQASVITEPALSADKVLFADEDQKGRLWACTGGGGINVISPDRKQITALRTEDGLSDNEVYHLFWQDTGRLWISTFNGLSTYSPAQRTFYNYYTADGLSSNEFNHSAFLRDHTGKIYFGTINGINAFYPGQITRTGTTARLFASAITKWDNHRRGFVHLLPADTSSMIVLQPLDHSLRFNLALTDYHSPESNIFRYRIKGLFDDWVSFDGQQALRLDGLAAGHYTLEIMALDNRGTPAANILRYRIDVLQPFYKSWWFYLGLSVLASGLLAGFFFLRLQQVKKVQRLREQIASDLHDEVGSLLTRITMTSDNLRYSANTEEDRSSKLEKIAALSRNAASSMSDVLWAVDARNDYTGNLADRIREHAEEMLLPLGIDLQFDFQVSQRMSISSELRQQVYLICKEAINNIVKHSTATEVTISYYHNEHGFAISLVNNGYNEKEKSSVKGQGLKNMAMRAARIGATSIAKPNGDRFEVLVSKP